MRPTPKIHLTRMKLLLLITLTLSIPLLTLIPSSAVAAAEPQLTLTPNSGFSDAQVRMHGVNFALNSQIRIRWESLLYGDVYTSTSPYHGSFDIVTDVPDGLPAGIYTVTATDADGNTASANFTLYSVFSDGTSQGSVGIKNSKQIVTWNYSSTSFYCDSWTLFHDSQNNWYNLMMHDYGLYVLRLTYNGTTYVFDLANGAFNAYPVPLIEQVTGFDKVMDPSHIQGKISIYNPTGQVLLATIIATITAPAPSESYYTLVFNVTSEADLKDVALYTAYNLNVYQPPNSAMYSQNIDGVCQYYGPSHYGSQIPEQYKGAAGFASLSPTSAHHDVDIAYTNVLQIAKNLRQYDFNYRDRNEVYGDAFGNVAIGLQWNIGTLNKNTKTTVPIIFAASDTTIDALENSIIKGKVSLQTAASNTPTINVATSQAPGTSIISVSGQNYMPYAKINLCFGGITIASYSADNQGVFQGNFIVPTSVTGDYSLTATDNYGLSATTSFTVTELTLQWLLDELDSMNASITGLIKDVNGTLSALINTKSGSIIASLSDINATLVGLIGDNQNVTISKIDTVLGTVNATVEEINAHIVEIIGDAKGDILARIDSNVGETLAKVDQINATLVGIIGDATGAILARIDTNVGETLAKVDQINATIIGIIGDAKGDLLARIDSKVGETLAKVDQINATLVGIIGDATGDVLARIDTKVGETLVKVDQINATLVDIIGDAEGNVLARIDSRVGETLVKVNQINATLVDVVGDAKSGILARIDSNVGEALVKLDTINGQMSKIEDDVVTIKSDVGDIQMSLSDINAKVTDINGTVATIQTNLGILVGNITDMQGDIATIKTDLGTLKLTTKPLTSQIDLQPFTILAVAEIIALAAIIYTIYTLRIRRKAAATPSIPAIEKVAPKRRYRKSKLAKDVGSKPIE